MGFVFSIVSFLRFIFNFIFTHPRKDIYFVCIWGGGLGEAISDTIKVVGQEFYLCLTPVSFALVKKKRDKKQYV